jgi:hypothetical protein
VPTRGRPPADLKGKPFGSLVAEKLTRRRRHGCAVWLCRCACGRTHHATSRDLNRGDVVRCTACTKEFIRRVLNGRPKGRVRLYLKLRKRRWPVKLIARRLGVSHQGVYRALKRWRGKA